MKHIGLFEGIGGFSLAARWAGWETIAWCEWNEFGQTVLKHHFPNAKPHGDITKTDFTIYRGQCDIVTGGFPCQPYSAAGKRKGKEDERHLWPEMLRAIREIAPTWVVGENVRGLVNWNGGLVFDEVQTDLEACGYQVVPYLLPAVGVDAPHRRDRIWFAAFNAGNADSGRRQKRAVKEFFGEKQGFESGGNSEITSADSDDEKRIGRSGSGEREGQTSEQGRNGILSSTSRPSQERTSSDTESERLRKTREHINRYTKRTSGTGGEQPVADANEFHVTNSSGSGLQRGTKQRSIEGRGSEPQEQSARFIRPNWQIFPTQSPVCSGDDGISDRLDPATVFGSVKSPRQPARAFGKWRNESIKAAGNAIVPQVAYQIFKAINEYENLKHI